MLTRHEQGAAFMAEVYGRLTGNPAVCLGTLGPGATNLITGVADANMDRAPLLVLTGQGASTRLHKESHQIMDVVEHVPPVTKWATSDPAPGQHPGDRAQGRRLARTEKPGACHIELPEDIAEAGDRPPGRSEPRRFRRPVPADKIIDQAMELHRRAPDARSSSPATARSGSAPASSCASSARTPASAWSAPSWPRAASTWTPTTASTPSACRSKDFVSCAIDAADLVITLGYDMVEYHPRLWNPDGDKRIVHIDFLPAEIDEHYHPDVEIVGDLAHTLWMLNERLRAGRRLATSTSASRRGARATCRRSSPRTRTTTPTGIDPAPEGALGRPPGLGPDDILLSDVGAHKMWIARHYQCHEPNTCLIPNGFCSMGFALPGAIAAAMVHPERRVLAICGDGGFLMNVQEMETARRLGSNIVVMVWEDGGYGLIAWKQETRIRPAHGPELRQPRLEALAEAFGWRGHQVEKSRELAACWRPPSRRRARAWW